MVARLRTRLGEKLTVREAIGNELRSTTHDARKKQRQLGAVFA